MGTESLAEFFIMDLPEPLKETEEAIKLLNSKLPPGLKVSAVKKHPGKIAQKLLTSYTLTLDRSLTEKDIELIDIFVASSSFVVERIRKGKSKPLDIRPLIRRISPSGSGTVELETINITSSPGIKPIEALRHIIKLDKDTALLTSIVKTGWSAL